MGYYLIVGDNIMNDIFVIWIYFIVWFHWCVRIIVIKNIFLSCISESVRLENNTTLRYILTDINSPSYNNMFGYIRSKICSYWAMVISKNKKIPLHRWSILKTCKMSNFTSSSNEINGMLVPKPNFQFESISIKQKFLWEFEIPKKNS